MSRSVICAPSFATLLMAVFLAGTPAAAQQVGAPFVTPDSVKWNPAPFPGISIAVAAGNPTTSGTYAIFVKFASGAKALPHTHPDQRIVTVISGAIYVGMGTEIDPPKAVMLKAGSVIVIPADAPHFGWTTDSEAILQEVGAGPTGTKVWPQAAAK